MFASSSARHPRRILFAHFGRDWIRGSEQCLLDLVAHIDREEFEPMVVCNQPTLAAALRNIGATVQVLPELAPAEVVARRNQVRALTKVFDNGGAELIHVNTTALLPSLWQVARAQRVPLLAHIHIIPSASERRHQLLHQADMIVGVSHASLDGLAEEGVTAKRLRVIHNAVDGARIERGDARALREQLSIAATDIAVVAVGSLITRKAHDVAIRAIARARETDSRLQLIVCGAGEEESALRDLAVALGVQQFVHFLGFREDVGAILRDAADVCIAPSQWEAMPLNVLEAQWMGVPVVASDIPAHREAMVVAGTALFAPTGDVAAFASALVCAASDGRLSDAAHAAKAEAQQHLSMARYVTQFQSVYRELLASGAGGYGWLSGTRWPAAYNEWTRELLSKKLSRLTRRRAQ